MTDDAEFERLMSAEGYDADPAALQLEETYRGLLQINRSHIDHFQPYKTHSPDDGLLLHANDKKFPDGHPHTIRLRNRMLTALGIPASLETPANDLIEPDTQTHPGAVIRKIRLDREDKPPVYLDVYYSGDNVFSVILKEDRSKQFKRHRAELKTKKKTEVGEPSLEVPRLANQRSINRARRRFVRAALPMDADYDEVKVDVRVIKYWAVLQAGLKFTEPDDDVLRLIMANERSKRLTGFEKQLKRRQLGHKVGVVGMKGTAMTVAGAAVAGVSGVINEIGGEFTIPERGGFLIGGLAAFVFLKHWRGTTPDQTGAFTFKNIKWLESLEDQLTQEKNIAMDYSTLVDRS